MQLTQLYLCVTFGMSGPYCVDFVPFEWGAMPPARGKAILPEQRIKPSPANNPHYEQYSAFCRSIDVIYVPAQG